MNGGWVTESGRGRKMGRGGKSRSTGRGGVVIRLRRREWGRSVGGQERVSGGMMARERCSRKRCGKLEVEGELAENDRERT